MGTERRTGSWLADLSLAGSVRSNSPLISKYHLHRRLFILFDSSSGQPVWDPPPLTFIPSRGNRDPRPPGHSGELCGTLILMVWVQEKHGGQDRVQNRLNSPRTRLALWEAEGQNTGSWFLCNTALLPLLLLPWCHSEKDLNPEGWISEISVGRKPYKNRSVCDGISIQRGRKGSGKRLRPVYSPIRALGCLLHHQSPHRSSSSLHETHAPFSA